MPVRSWIFRAEGVDEVVRGHERIRQSEEKLGRARERMYGSAGGSGGGGGGRSAAAPGKSPQAKLAEQVAKDQARAEERKARTIARIRDASLRKEQQMLDRADAAKKRSAEKSMREDLRTRERHARDAARLNSQMAAIEQRELEKHTQQRKRMMAGLRSSAGAAAWGLAGGVAAAGIAAGGAFVGIAGASLRERLAAKDQAIALSNAGRQAGQAGVSADALLSNATRTALSVRGTKASDVLAAQAKFVQMTGDLGAASANARTFAITARATGSSEEDIAAVSATMREKFGIRDPEVMRNTLAALTGQGKTGAFELRDASQYFTEMGAAGARFGLGSGEQGVKTLGGLAQLSMKSVGGGAKASTATQAMLRQLVAESDQIKRVTKTDVFTDSSKTKTNDIKDILVGTIAGAGGNLGKLQKIFKEEGIGGASELIKVFNEASAAVGKNATAEERRAAGENAMRKVLDESINAGGDWSDMLKDYAAATDTAGATLTTAWEKLSSDVGDALAPAFSKVVTAVAPLAGSLRPFAEGVAIATDRIVGLAKRMGWVKEGDAAARVSTTPKADLFNVAGELAGLDAKEKRLGGLTTADQQRRSELMNQQLELKDRLLQEDPSLGDPIFGSGPMRPEFARTGLSAIMAGQNLESRAAQVAEGARLPDGVDANAVNTSASYKFAEQLHKESFLGKIGLLGGAMFENVSNGRPVFETPMDQDRAARQENTANLRQQYLDKNLGSALDAVSLNDAELIAALNNAAAAFKSGGFSTNVKGS